MDFLHDAFVRSCLLCFLWVRLGVRGYCTEGFCISENKWRLRFHPFSANQGHFFVVDYMETFSSVLFSVRRSIRRSDRGILNCIKSRVVCPLSFCLFFSERVWHRTVSGDIKLLVFFSFSVVFDDIFLFNLKVIKVWMQVSKNRNEKIIWN